MRYLLLLGLICLFASAFIANESRTIEGTVKDQNGQPITGASVQIKGTATGTVTDSNGHFEIVLPKDNAILVISSVNYAPTEFKVNREIQYILS